MLGTAMIKVKRILEHRHEFIPALGGSQKLRDVATEGGGVHGYFFWCLSDSVLREGLVMMLLSQH